MMRFMAFLVLFMWMLAMASSYRALISPASGMGFTLGLGRFGEVIGWQIMATIMAVALWRLGRDWPKGPLRLLSILPVLIALAIGLFVLGQIANVMLLGG